METAEWAGGWAQACTWAPPPLIAGQNDVRKFEWRRWRSLTDVRFAPENGHIADIGGRLKSAH